MSETCIVSGMYHAVALTLELNDPVADSPAVDIIPAIGPNDLNTVLAARRIVVRLICIPEGRDSQILVRTSRPAEALLRCRLACANIRSCD